MPDQKPSIFIGALVVALLSTSYLGIINCFCCAGVILGAMAAVWHYTSRHHRTIPAGRGAIMGLIAAALGTLIAVILNALLAQVGLGVSEAATNAVMDIFRESLSPEQLEEIRTQAQQQSFGAYVTSGLLSIAVASIFGAIGGAIGASIFKKGGETPEQPPPAA